MKKKMFKKAIASAAALLTLSAVAAPMTASAVDTAKINTSPAEKLASPAASCDIQLKKDIVLFNVDASAILEPNITYSYEVTAPAITDKTITTYSPDDLDTDGKTPKTGAVPVTMTVRSGVIGAVSAEGDDTSTSDKVETTIVFGTDNTTTKAANDEYGTNTDATIDLSKKVSKNSTITINANKIYDPNYGTDGHTNTQVNGPGVYRYQIKDTTLASTYTASGVTDGAATDIIYLDVYTKYNNAKNGLEIYGYVLLKENQSINYNKDTTTETIKITGFDTESENTATTTAADLKSDSYHTYNVEVSKKTEGSLGDTTHNFPFMVELTNAAITSADDFYYVITKDGSDLTQVITSLADSGSWTLNGITNADTNLQLQNGDKILITGLPVGTKIKVTEKNDTADKYTASAKVNDSAVDVKTGSSTGASLSVESNNTAELKDSAEVSKKESKDTIKFTNTLKEISVTGLLFNIAPFVFIVIAGGLLLFVFMKNKKHTESDSRI